eukprot:483706_1
MMKLKTFSQALQLLVVISSIILQYYWFVENKSPIQLFKQTKSKILNEYIYQNASIKQKTESPPKQNTLNEIINEEHNTNINPNNNNNQHNTTQYNHLLPNLILYEFEETLKHFKYNEYQSKSTMYLQFWTLLFESLSNNYHFQSTRNNKDIHDIPLNNNAFRHKAWQKQPILLKTRDIFQLYAPSNNMQKYYVSKLLHLNTVIGTFDNNKIYESPYTMFFHEKIHSVNMDLNEYKRQNKILSPEYISFKLSIDTLVINNAGLIFKNIALLEQIIMNTMFIPVNTNAYISGMRTQNDQYSSKIHSDRQDIFIIQTQGKKRWQVWEPNIKNPRFEQIRGKDENEISEKDISKLKLLYDIVLEPGDILYIPRGYLHQVTLYNNENDLYMTKEDEYSIHLSMGLEIDTLGFTMESFMFCSMGIALQNKNKLKDEKKLEQKLENHSRLTWLSGYLWQWTFMEEETRKVFPFFESEYLLKIVEMEQNKKNINNLQKFQKELYDKTMDLINKFEIALRHTKGVDENMLKKNSVPMVSVNDIKYAHNIFHKGLMKLKSLFLAKLSLQRDKEYKDVMDRNAKFDALMVEEISNVYQRCGVPVDIVGDGEQEFNVNGNK